MSVITIPGKEKFNEIMTTFNEKSDLFIKLLIFFAPVIFMTHIAGALLDPYYMNAERISRITCRGLLLGFAYMWLVVLIENRTTINPFKEINARLGGFVILAAIGIFLPFEIVRLAHWGFVIANLHGDFYSLLLNALYIVMAYLIISQSFSLLGLVEGKTIMLHKSIRMSQRHLLPFFTSLVFRMLPLAFGMFMYMHILNFVIMKFELTEHGPVEAVMFSILYAPVFLLIHPFLIAMAFTGLYLAYTQAKAGENQSNAGNPVTA